MRNIYAKSMVILVIMTFTMGFLSERLSATTFKPQGDEEIVKYCYGAQFKSDQEHFRDSATGESRDQQMSEKNAVTKARANLADQIGTLVKSVIDNYVKSYIWNNRDELLVRYETLSREAVKQLLSGTVVICNLQTKTKEGKFKTHYTLELESNAVFSAISSKLSGDQVVRVDFIYDKFERIFKQEMSNMYSSQ